MIARQVKKGLADNTTVCIPLKNAFCQSSGYLGLLLVNPKRAIAYPEFFTSHLLDETTLAVTPMSDVDQIPCVFPEESTAQVLSLFLCGLCGG